MISVLPTLRRNANGFGGSFVGYDGAALVLVLGRYTDATENKQGEARRPNLVLITD